MKRTITLLIVAALCVASLGAFTCRWRVPGSPDWTLADTSAIGESISQAAIRGEAGARVEVAFELAPGQWTAPVSFTASEPAPYNYKLDLAPVMAPYLEKLGLV